MKYTLAVLYGVTLITIIYTTSVKRRTRDIEVAAMIRAKADTVCSMSMDLNLSLLCYH